MSKRIGKFTKIWVDGYQLTTTSNAFSTAHTGQENEAGGYTQDMSYLIGRDDGTINLAGFFSEDTHPTHTALEALVGIPDNQFLVSAAIGANTTPTLGDPTFHLLSGESQYTVSTPLNGVVGVTAAFKAKGYPIEYGRLLGDATITTDTDGSSLDHGASTDEGGVGFLHITGLSSGDTIVVKIQDSADNSNWADLITFTVDGSALASERIAVTGTVDRYLRATYDVTGASISFPVFVAFMRNIPQP
jgi:hypothetical protein